MYLAIIACNYLAAGITIQIVETTFDFFLVAKTSGSAGLVNTIGKVSYYFTTTALFQGLSNLFWIPMMNKYGRRPMYLISFAIYFVSAIRAAFTFSYGSFLASRMLMGFAAGAAEGLHLSVSQIVSRVKDYAAPPYPLRQCPTIASKPTQIFRYIMSKIVYTDCLLCIIAPSRTVGSIFPL